MLLYIFYKGENKYEEKIELYLLVDHSASTTAFIGKINDSIKNMIEMLKNQHKYGDLLGFDVDFIFIPFNHTYKIYGPTPIDEVEVKDLEPTGATDIGSPLIKAILMAKENYMKIKNKGEIRAYRPIIFLFTGGVPDAGIGCTPEEQAKYDSFFEKAAEIIKEDEARKLSFVAFNFQEQEVDSETYKINTEKIKKLTSFDDRVIEISSGKDREKLNPDPLSELDAIFWNLVIESGPTGLTGPIHSESILKDGIDISFITN